MSSTTRAQTASVAGPLTLLQAAAVSQWYEQFTSRLRAYIASALLRHAEGAFDADDVIQETFIRLMRHVTHVSSLTEAHRANYVFQTAQSAAHDLWRRGHGQRERQWAGAKGLLAQAVPLSAVANSAMEPVTASHDWQASMQPEQTTAARLTLRAVWEATPPEHREMVALLAAGFDTEQIAARLGIKQRAVILRCWRLRPMLREVAEALA